MSKHLIGSTGLHYCCYRLSRLGWNVMPTARNAPGIDLVAYNQDGSRTLLVQVKSSLKNHPVPLGKGIDGHVASDFWLIVTNLATDPVTYVMLPDEIKALAQRSEKDGRVSHWLETKKYSTDEFREKWDRIGTGWA